jgi:short-subunit dehydrogenase
MTAATDVTLVTGASGGIGADLARIFGRNGHRLVLTARNADAMAALSNEIVAGGGIAPVIVPLDLEEQGAVERLAQALQERSLRCAILVNNAGYGLAADVADAPSGALTGMIDLNIRSLTEATKRFLPDILSARGRILNVASTAAFYPGPGMAVYYASKAYVLSFSEALWFELRPRGVTVTALCPGPTATGFQQRARLDGPLFNMKRPMDSMAVAEEGYRGLMKGRRVVVTGVNNKVLAFVSHLVPNTFSLPAVSWLVGARREG